MVNTLSIQKTDNIHRSSDKKPTAPNVFAYRPKIKTEDSSFKILAGLAGLAVIATAGILYARKGRKMNEKIHIKPLEPEIEIIEETAKRTQIPEDKIEVEKWLSKLAREKGISTPEFQNDGTYKLLNQVADAKNNPIKPVHFDAIHNNIFLMDSNGILHNDIDINNVLYSSKNNNVEFIGYGNGFTFSIKDGGFVSDHSKEKLLFPEYMMPSNQVDYESNCLGKYFSALSDPKEESSLMSSYLQSSAVYHKQRAEFLAKNGFKESAPKMYEYEVIQSEIFKKPTKDLIELRKQRIDFKNKQRLAFTEWDEGAGANGYEFSAERKLSAIPMYMDAIESCVNYIEKIKKMAIKSKDNKFDAYLNQENGFGNYWLSNYFEWVKGMAEFSFSDPKVIQGTDAERKAIIQAIDVVKNSTLEDQSKAITKFKELYSKMVKKYNFEV